MNEEKTNRYIAPKTAEELWSLCRGRCCLCRIDIPVEKRDWADLSEYLEKNHLIYHSRGGDSSIENLVLVCPNCHTAIHRFPRKYPVEEIMEKKSHWISLKDFLPDHFAMPKKKSGIFGNKSGNNAAIPVRAEIHLITLNLRYFIEIGAGSDTTIDELGQFVLSEIIKPITEHGDLYSWKDVATVNLAYESALNKEIDPNESVMACIKKDDPFVPTSKISQHYALVGPSTVCVLRASIKDPLKDLLKLRHTTKTLLQTRAFYGPLEDLDLLDSWHQMVDDQNSRTWLKKATLLLDDSQEWRETLSHYWERLQDEDKSIACIVTFSEEMQKGCKEVFDKLTAGADNQAAVPLETRRMVLWSIIRGHILNSIEAWKKLRNED